MRAEVLTYSRARGVFAGLSLNGASIRQDQDSTRSFYGHMVPYRSLLTGLTPVPPDANPFIEPLRKYAGTAKAAATPPAASTPADPRAGATPAKPASGTTPPATPSTPPANPPANPPKR